jgi:hypothetical protein
MVVSDFEGKGMSYVTGGILQTYFGNPELLGPFYCSFCVDVFWQEIVRTVVKIFVV